MPKKQKNNLATEAQKELLIKHGVSIPDGLTISKASILIGKIFPCEAGEYQKEVLNFFKIKFSDDITESAAAEMIEVIFEDSSKKEKWENRLASQRQKESLIFFGCEIKQGLKHAEAEIIINEILEDDDKADAWYKEEGRLDDIDDERLCRIAAIDELLEEMNEDAFSYKVKKISKIRHRKVVEYLENKGMTLEEIGSLEQRSLYFETLSKFSVVNKRVNIRSNAKKNLNTSDKSPSSRGCFALLFALGIVPTFVISLWTIFCRQGWL